MKTAISDYLAMPMWYFVLVLIGCFLGGIMFGVIGKIFGWL